MATEGLLTLEAGIALALGANIGTCVTALMAAMGKPVEAVRAAIVHVLFNIIGVVIWLPFIGILADLATAIFPIKDGIEGGVKVVSVIPRQIANANTLFNVINTILFISFTSVFARIAEKIYPEKIKEVSVIIEPKFLDEAAVEVPSIALEQVRQEYGRIGEIACKMLNELAVLSIQLNNQSAAMEVINKKETVAELVESLVTRKAEVLGREKEDDLETARIEISLIDKISRAYTLTRRIAKITVPPAISIK